MGLFLSLSGGDVGLDVGQLGSEAGSLGGAMAW